MANISEDFDKFQSWWNELAWILANASEIYSINQ